MRRLGGTLGKRTLRMLQAVVVAPARSRNNDIVGIVARGGIYHFVTEPVVAHIYGYVSLIVAQIYRCRVPVAGREVVPVPG